MSTSPSELSPWIELHVGDEKLSTAEAGALALAAKEEKPDKTIRHTLTALRAFVIRAVLGRLKGYQDIDNVVLAAELDRAWVQFRPTYRHALIPLLTMAYSESFLRARAGQVDPALVNALAVEHADRMGQYFHDTSKEALLQGFSRFVNRKVPTKVAAVRIMDAYGLTPRQVSGLTSLADQTPVQSAVPQDLKAKVRTYIARAFGQRLKIFSQQEEHNLTMQAAQTAWLWMVEHGQMGAQAEKIWITAKDERVCEICGPLHGTTVPVTEKFITRDGQHFWVPGAHTNCRCWVRVREPLKNHLQPIHKAGISYIDWEPEEHPRDHEGRFAVKTRTLDRPQLDTQPQLDKPNLGGPNLSGPTLSAPQLGSPQLSGPQLDAAPDLSRPEMSSVNLGPSLHHPDAMLAPPSLSAIVANPVQLPRAAPAQPRPDYNPDMPQGKPEPTKRPKKVFGKDAPYVVLENWEIDQHTGAVEINEGHDFKDIRSVADFDAADKFFDQIHAKERELIKDRKQVKIRPEDLAAGSQLPDGMKEATATLAAGYEWDVVYAAALEGRHERKDKELYWRNTVVEFEVKIPDRSAPSGYRIEDVEVNVQKAAKLLNVKPDIKTVYVARLKEGLVETTHNTVHPTRKGITQWITNGRFRAERSDEQVLIDGVQVSVVDLYVDDDYYRELDSQDRD